MTIFRPPAARTFTTIRRHRPGRTMGAGHRRGLRAPRGVRRRRRREGRREAWRTRTLQHLERSNRPLRGAHAASQTEARRAEPDLLGGRITFSTALKDLFRRPTFVVAERSCESLETKRRRCSATSTRSCRPRRCWRRAPPACRSPGSRPPTPRHPGGSSASTSSTPPRRTCEIVRTVVTEDRCSPTPRRWWSRSPQRTRSSCGDKAGFIANAPLRLPQPRRPMYEAPLR